MSEHFTCRELNYRNQGDSCNRWAIDGPQDGNSRSYEGSFPDEETARATAKRWNETGGEAVRIGWSRASTDSEHDRGIYTVTVKGTNYRRIRTGWHGMERAAELAGGLREQIATRGLDTVIDILNSVER